MLASSSQNTSSPWKVFWLTSVAVFLVSIDATILFISFGAIQKTFPHATSAHLSWVLNAYSIMYAALLVPAGRLADMHGDRKIFLFGVTIFIFASALCGLSPSSEMLIAARALQAVGAALLTPSSLSLVLAAFPPAKRPVAVALWGAVAALAGAVGPSTGAFIVDHFGWQYAFYVNVPIGLISIVRGLSALREHRTGEPAVAPDIFGIFLLISGVGLLSLGVVQSGEWGALDMKTVSAVLTGALLLLAFISWSGKSKAPALDLTLFRSANFSYVNLATFCFGITFTTMFFGFFFFLTKIWGYSLSLSGLAVSPGPLLVIPVAIISGKFAARLGHRVSLVLGGFVFAGGAMWLFIGAGPSPQFLSVWLPGMLLTGLGVGLTLPSLSGAAVHGLPGNRLGVGIAVNTAIRQMGSVFGVAATVLMVGGKNVDLPHFQTLFALLVLGGVLTSVCCLAVDTRPAARTAGAQPSRA
ncbi:DHA2 family efflux MFS transporter permease subunit [Paraherbaspirillum soli]|uniref:DHA2 family efflux MFS transporter permease subunit n=1 Tax=Paraherbaspirillum soli TaxID=631222 RepID=A0ABW0MG38_9BURK